MNAPKNIYRSVTDWGWDCDYLSYRSAFVRLPLQE